MPKPDHLRVVHDLETQPAAPPEVITVDEAADLLRVDRRTVYSLIKRGKIPGVRRVGRSIRLSRTKLLAWLEAG